MESFNITSQIDVSNWRQSPELIRVECKVMVRIWGQITGYNKRAPFKRGSLNALTLTSEMHDYGPAKDQLGNTKRSRVFSMYMYAVSFCEKKNV